MSIVHYDYHKMVGFFKAERTRARFSDRMMNNVTRLLTLGSSQGMSQQECDDIHNFGKQTNSDGSRAMLATALTLLKSHLKESGNVNFARLRKGCDEARIYSDKGRYLRSLPYAVKTVKSLQDLSQPIAPPSPKTSTFCPWRSTPKAMKLALELWLCIASST